MTGRKKLPPHWHEEGGRKGQTEKKNREELYVRLAVKRKNPPGL